jgi:hypothetical protein
MAAMRGMTSDGQDDRDDRNLAERLFEALDATPEERTLYQTAADANLVELHLWVRQSLNRAAVHTLNDSANDEPTRKTQVLKLDS